MQKFSAAIDSAIIDTLANKARVGCNGTLFMYPRYILKFFAA
jgi:hypothetical protein